MKKSRLLIVSGLSMMLGLGVVGGLIANKSVQPIKKVEATISSVASGTKFYVDLTAFGSWLTNNPDIKVGFNGCSDSTYEGCWSNAATEVTTGIYCVTVPGTNCTYTKASAKRGTWNATPDLTITSNCIKVTDWNAGQMETLYGANSGDGVYVNYNNVDWWGNDLNTYVYFFNAFDGSDAVWSEQAQIVQGTTDKILEVEVPGSGKTYGSCVVVRCQTAKSWDGAYNQTVDYCLLNSTSVHNGIVVESSVDGSGHNYCSWEYSYNLSDATRAEMYGTYFLSEITCSGSGSITSTSTNWENVETEYNHIAKNPQGEIWLTSGVISGGSDIETAMYRYDYIVLYKHYSGYNDFISRSTSTAKSFSAYFNQISILSNSENMGGLLIVVLASALTVSTVAGYFLLRRKKQK